MRKFLDSIEKHFVKGGKLEKLYPIYELVDTFLYTPSSTNTIAPFVRDMLDQKRTMITVIMALTPVVLFCLFNTGYQINSVIDCQLNRCNYNVDNWRHKLYLLLGFQYDANNIIANIVFGALYFFPAFLTVQIIGGICEVIFAVIRKHEVSEGFLVTGMLIPLIIPPTTPLWQVAIGSAFGIVIGKEIFGGVGRNIFNPAITARMFLYFAYPAQHSGDSVWVGVDGYSSATGLAILAADGMQGLEESTIDWFSAFVGLIPGSFGETSTIACLLGAAILILSRIGSWQIMLSCFAGMVSLSLLFNIIGSETNPMFAVSPMWHLVLGGFAFGTVFMATDPVSACHTQKGKWIYGFLIGSMTVLIRVINPAFPEGIMLAIMFANTFSPLIDYFVVNENKKRRKIRSAT